MHRAALVTTLGFAGLLGLAALAAAEEPQRDPSLANGVEPIVVDEPAFPGAILHDRVRIWTSAYVAPRTDFGGQDLGLVRSELRVRTRVPIGETLSVQLTGEFRSSVYDEDGAGALFKDCPDCPEPDDLYAAGLGVQGGYLLNRSWSLFRADEQWAVLAAVFGLARWEPGAFDESITPGTAISLGYQLPKRLRISLGARIERALDGNSVEVTPTGSLHWQLTPTLELRDRELGLQLEYRPWARWELFAAAFRSGDSFRLDRRPGAPSGMTFLDKQVSVGAGVAFKVFRALRIAAEMGAIVDRQVAVEARDDGRLDSANGDVSPYFSLRLELRP